MSILGDNLEKFEDWDSYVEAHAQKYAVWGMPPKAGIHPGCLSFCAMPDDNYHLPSLLLRVTARTRAIVAK